MRVWDEGGEFKELVMKDAEISGQLTREKIEQVFSLDTYLRNVDVIFARVFTDQRPQAEATAAN